MATIVQEASGNFRVRVRRKGYRSIQKTFPVRSEAETWAKTVEMTIFGERARYEEPFDAVRRAMEVPKQIEEPRQESEFTIETVAPANHLQWLIWDTTEALTLHPGVKDSLGCDLFSLMFVEYENEMVRVASTTRPMTMLRSSIKLSATFGKQITHVLLSKPMVGLNRGCLILCKRLLDSGYQSVGERIFRGITISTLLRTLRLTYPDMDEPVPSQSVLQLPHAVSEKDVAEVAAPDQAIVVRSVPRIAILGTDIRKDADGRYCLNDLHRASGGNNAHRPSLWVQNKQTQELIAEIVKAGIPALKSIRGGRYNGTYVCKELVYAYAMWVSPRFHLTVIHAFDAMVADKQYGNVGASTVQEAIEQKAWRIASDERDRLLALLGGDAEDDIWKIAVRIRRRVHDELRSLARSFGPSVGESPMIAIANWSPDALNSRRDG